MALKVDTHTHKPAEVCAALRISPPTLVRWAKDPDFPQPLRITKRVVRYDLDAIKRHLSDEAA